jgi:hypothetical protein
MVVSLHQSVYLPLVAQSNRLRHHRPNLQTFVRAEGVETLQAEEDLRAVEEQQQLYLWFVR